MEFKYKFTKLIFSFMIITIALSIGCFVLNVVRLIKTMSSNIDLSIYEDLSIYLSIIISVLFVIIILGSLINSKYIIKDNKLIVKFFILTEKYEIKNFEAIERNLTKNILRVVFSDQTILNVNIDSSKHSVFADSILALNNKIIYKEMSQPDVKY